MTNEVKIQLLQSRYNLIMKRGFHNNKIGNKILRKIRLLQKNEEVS